MIIIIRVVEALIGLSLVTIFFLLWRHRGHWFVGFEDLEQHEREFHRKHELTIGKIERELSRRFTQTLHYVKPVIHGTKAVMERQYHRLVELEKRYRQSVQSLKLSGPQRVEMIMKTLEQADLAKEEERWVDAEQRYIEVITMQKSHIRAYEGLGEVYWNTNQWKEAMETYRFLHRLLKDKTPIGYYHRWGESAKEVGKFAQAVEAFERALAVEPRNPRTLDLLAESAILGGNVGVAANALQQLLDVNPDNQKIPEFEQRVQELRASLVAKPEG